MRSSLPRIVGTSLSTNLYGLLYYAESIMAVLGDGEKGIDRLLKSRLLASGEEYQTASCFYLNGGWRVIGLCSSLTISPTVLGWLN